MRNFAIIHPLHLQLETAHHSEPQEKVWLNVCLKG